MNSPPYEQLTRDVASFVPDVSLFVGVAGSRPVGFTFLAHTLAEIRKTRSRTAISNALTNFMRIILIHHPQSLVAAVYLLSNTLSPPYTQVELGLGPSAISQSIQQVSGLTSAALRKLYNKFGDPGDVAFEAKSNMRTLLPHAPLSICDVHSALLKIAACKGQGAAKQKQKLVEKLLVATRGEESRFLVRILSQNLRVGAVRTSILTALARAMVLNGSPTFTVSSDQMRMEWYASPSLLHQIETGDTSAQEELRNKFKRADSILRRVFATHPDYDHVISALMDSGFATLHETVPLTVGIPLHPTLGTPARSVAEIYERFGDLEFSAEFKYDGQRAQVHVENREGRVSVSIFSRHLEDMTNKYPDVVATMTHIFEGSDLTAAIIDSEIVAIDPNNGQLKSFQELSGRARKAVSLQDIDIPVCIFAFDVMHLNGKNLLDDDFRTRRALLHAQFPAIEAPAKGLASLAHVRRCDSAEGSAEMEAFWATAVKSQSEGLMVKLLDTGGVSDPESSSASPSKKLSAKYNVDQRTFSWIKLKKDYVTGIGDTLDLVPIGAWHGNGRKAQWWSPILLGLWNTETGRPIAVCKCMSEGFSDAFYKDLNIRYSLEDSGNCSRQPLWECELGGLRPQVYFKPQEVWEIRGADITLSPVSLAAQGSVSSAPEKGLSIRFPRFIRLRPDKTTSQASTPLFLSQMYRNQPGIASNLQGEDNGDLEDPATSEPDESDVSL
ncbi:ATP-dependent DNA ligase [Mucidula mucida]|nr:ATP-dependent DNA ligase [Mucidula mucida]